MNMPFKLRLACCKHTLVQLGAAYRTILLLLPVFVLPFLRRKEASAILVALLLGGPDLCQFVYCAFQEAMRTNIPVVVPEGAHLACDE